MLTGPKGLMFSLLFVANLSHHSADGLIQAMSNRGNKPPLDQDVPNVDNPVPIKSVDAVIGGKAELPCDIYPSDSFDEVYLVLWYRDIAGRPLYSFDVRSKNPIDGKHWSAQEPFGGRAYFRAESNTSYLLISDVKLEDEGLYRCRVDYRNSPTRNVKLNLTVVVPPHSPQIISGDDRIDTSRAIAGVYNEGDVMDLTCVSVGGRPLPSVTWWVNGKLIDNTFHTESKDKMVNKLKHFSAERPLNDALLECRASNNNSSRPQSRMLKIEINLSPQKVKIKRIPKFFAAGKEYTLACQAEGSRPSPRITWFNGYEVMKPVRENIRDSGQITVSIVKFKPMRSDNGKAIRCIAENPEMKGSSIEDSLRLKVSCQPSLVLNLGPSLRIGEIKEGDDIYFECHVDSNPVIDRLEWHLGDQLLEHDLSKGIIFSNRSLVIQKIHRNHSGQYSCQASNSLGHGKSNSINLTVKHRPVCDPNMRIRYGVAAGETVPISCHLIADPPVQGFKWWASHMGKTRQIPSREFRHNGSLSVIFHKQPSSSSSLQYGTLNCIGFNSVGNQVKPCTFILTPASRPHSPTNCTVYDGNEGYAEVQCIANYNGGLKQRYYLEVFDSFRRKIFQNFSNPVAPHFVLKGLSPSNIYRMEIYADNRKGSSQRTIFTDVDLRSVLKNIGENDLRQGHRGSFSSGLEFDNVLVVVTVVGFSLIGLVLTLILIALKSSLPIACRQCNSSNLSTFHCIKDQNCAN